MLFMPMLRRARVIAVLLALLGPAAMAPAQDAAAPAVDSPSPAAEPTDVPEADNAAAVVAPTPIIPLDEVRVGMKGYGLTVFHGVRIEPFAVEVLSVMQDFGAKRGAIWIRCDDPRLEHSGPVQGMSGSPIYLWDEQEQAAGPDLGTGGRLAGAFAFGYAGGKSCYVGVQPIEQMRAIAARARAYAQDHAADASGAAAGQAATSQAASARQSFDALDTMSQAANLPTTATWRLDMLRKLLPGPAAAEDVRAPDNVPKGPAALGGRSVRLMVPLMLGSADLAGAMAPLFEPLGIAPLAAPVPQSIGTTPRGIDGTGLTLAPGSVICIPLGFGDLDMSASGTVTDILPDGSVLAFGHAMMGMGQGQNAVPMATGFVHYTQPSYNLSFKMAGSVDIQGAIVRDETAGIYGVPGGTFETAEVSVLVEALDQPLRDYAYHVVRHPRLTPLVAASAIIQSIVAVQNLPEFNTVTTATTLRFEGNRTLEYVSVAPFAAPQHVAASLVPPIAMLAQNEHESVMLESVDVDVKVISEPLVGSLVHTRLDQVEVAPGEELGVSLRIQPFGQAPRTHRAAVTIPRSLPDGQYQLLVLDARSYVQLMLGSRPHLLQTSDVDQMFALIEKIVSVPDDSMHIVLLTGREGLALGRQELPLLPSSRQAMIASPATTAATTYQQWVSTPVPIGLVVQGNAQLTVEVREDLSR